LLGLIRFASIVIALSLLAFLLLLFDFLSALAFGSS
jgi:hypothetical protein